MTPEKNPQNNDPIEINDDSAVEEKRIDLASYFNDESWPDMWYLNRGGVGSHDLDMNVYEAWTEGYTGIHNPKKLIKRFSYTG